MKLCAPLLFLSIFAASNAAAQTAYDPLVAQLRDKGMRELGAYGLLRELTSTVGARISGSPEAAKAVMWGKATMERLGFQNVRLVPCMVPHWIRGKTEQLTMGSARLTCCALGGSVGTQRDGVSGE